MKSFDYYNGDDLVEPQASPMALVTRHLSSTTPSAIEVKAYLNELLSKEESITMYRLRKAAYDVLKNGRMLEFWDDAKKEIVSQRLSMIFSEEVWKMMAENACSESGHLGTGAIYQSLVKYAAMICAGVEAYSGS